MTHTDRKKYLLRLENMASKVKNPDNIEMMIVDRKGKVELILNDGIGELAKEFRTVVYIKNTGVGKFPITKSFEWLGVRVTQLEKAQ